jgi:cyclopropane-fatty-acyl-phospholipid synthase
MSTARVRCASSHDAPRSRVPPRAARALLGVLEGVRAGALTLLAPDGQRHVYGGREPGPCATLRLRDWRVADDILRAADIGLAETYLRGDCDIDDIAALLRTAIANESALARAYFGRWWVILGYRLRHLARANTRRGSRRNIEAHYDLGNDFYRLWLDPGLTYSAALFDGDRARSLEAAQSAKYQRIVTGLGVREGQRILEIGCGWGGFAEHAARTRGACVTGITLSPAQLDWARQRIAGAALAQRVRLELLDYRDALRTLGGGYDHVVSIEMYEAVGERYWPGYFRTIHDALRPGGRALVQAITIDERVYPRYRRGTDFIQQHVFPGGMLASAPRFESAARAAGLVVEDAFRFGGDYAETLRRWARAFEAAHAGVRALGHDERFVRLWRFYLAYCEAGFDSGRTDVIQYRLRRPVAGRAR